MGKTSAETAAPVRPEARDPESGVRAGASPTRLGDVFFRQVVEGMRCAIVTVSGRGDVITMNEMAREILDVGEPVVEGVPVARALGHHPRLSQVLLDSLQMSHLPNRAEMEISAGRGGATKTIGFTISHIRGETGQEGVAVFFKDLTQVEQQEEQDRLRERLVALGQMAASMAHELRNPLASIDVTATLLRRRLLKRGEDVALVEKITAEVARLNSTVTRGLEFARPLAPDRSPQRITELLDQAYDEAQNRFPTSRVEVSRRYEAGLPRLLVDPQLLRQVFVNLIINALEAMGDEGRLELTARRGATIGRGAATVEVLVQDSGAGIPDEIREKLFYPFVTTKSGGSGIGLAMARKIIECHHGLIDVADAPDGGTIFRLRIPCESDARSAKG